MNLRRIIDYNKLDVIGKIIFWLSILFSPLFLVIFLCIYFLPFGINISESRNFEDIIEKKGNIILTDSYSSYATNFSNIDETLTLENSPLIDTIKTNFEISVEGNNVYLVQHHITEKDILENWKYTINLDNYAFNGSECVYLDNYTVENSNLTSFNLRFLPDWDDSSFPQLLLKYGSLKIILNKTNIELELDRLIDSDLITYHAYYDFDKEEKENIFDLTTTYKKATDQENGFIEIYVNNNLGQRITIPSKQKLINNGSYSNEYTTAWTEELLSDISQSYISLGQEEFTDTMLSGYSAKEKRSINLYKYYYLLYGLDLNINVNPDSATYYDNDWSDYFKSDVNDFSTLIQIFYPKTFYNYFKGTIYTLKIAYEYPFAIKTTETFTETDTPFEFFIYGENGTLDKINITTYKDSIWKK